MKFNPKKLLKPRVIVWAATTLVLVGTLIAANAVAVGEYGSLIDSVLGGKKAITAPRDKSDPSYKTKQQAYDAGNAVTEKICDEGMILLKNENKIFPADHFNDRDFMFGDFRLIGFDRSIIRGKFRNRN